MGPFDKPRDNNKLQGFDAYVSNGKNIKNIEEKDPKEDQRKIRFFNQAAKEQGIGKENENEKEKKIRNG